MSEDPFRLCDDLGPASILQVYQPKLALKAIVVVDNVATGPSIGGVRMAPDVSLEECARLARAMTLKNAAARLPHGGGKSVIFADPRMPAEDKELLVRAFATAIDDLEDYIPGPDMGTDETCMAWVQDEIGRSVGLPPELGGIPLDEIGATGFGLCVAAKAASEFCDVELQGARVAVQGFGSVGQHAARFLAQEGARLVAATDSRGGIHDPGGLDIEALCALKAQGQSVTDYGANRPGSARLEAEDLIGIECDIWIPAARPDVIHEGNVDRLQARLVLQGANIPATSGAEEILHHRNVLSIPDFIANAGGVICASVEYHGGSQTTAFQAIEEKIHANTRAVLEASQASDRTPRSTADELARERVSKAMSFGRWS